MKLIENFKDLMVNHPEDFARTKMKDLFIFEDHLNANQFEMNTLLVLKIFDVYTLQ